MTRHIALLRGINVGGKNLISMPALCEALVGAGFADVTSYIQSGNLLFSTPDWSEDVIVGRVQQVIGHRFSLTVPVVVRSAAELLRVAERHPFLAPGIDVSTVAIMFLGGVPTPEAVARLDPDRSAPDVWRLEGREIALWCPTTFAKTKLTIDYFERRLGVPATARNWRTVQTLAAMCRASE